MANYVPINTVVGATTLWVHVVASYERLTRPDTGTETLMSLSLRSSLSFAYVYPILICVTEAFN